MSFKDKLEVGLKPDAPYRPENLPDFQQADPACQAAGEAGEDATQENAREDCANPETRPQPAGSAPRRLRSPENGSKIER